ncbi:hypothetical protein [Saccharothrix luteola]|uniref:hypothetical protein n=1 Tax=Saccharothrix luteola TaxID=2893018 RepID=UPI001E56BE90|nr:hypothetical protein [Saccharothrix luteola]MCC8249648.1 hypothetical protein [Saccharothrix luteola]
MNTRRLEVLLPPDVPARDCAAVAHAIWAVLDEAGLGADGVLRVEEDEEDQEGDGKSKTAGNRVARTARHDLACPP